MVYPSEETGSWCVRPFERACFRLCTLSSDVSINLFLPFVRHYFDLVIVPFFPCGLRGRLAPHLLLVFFPSEIRGESLCRAFELSNHRPKKYETVNSLHKFLISSLVFVFDYVKDVRIRHFPWFYTAYSILSKMVRTTQALVIYLIAMYHI